MEDQISLWAYSRGEAARDLPYLLWKMVEEAGDWHKIIPQNINDDSTRIELHGDLIHWMEWLRDKAIVIIAHNETGDICGFGWYSDQIGGTALTSIWIAPRWRGLITREAVFAGIKFGYEMLGLKTLQTITPWPIARNLAKKCGFKEVAFIPKHFGPDMWLLEHERKI